MNNKKNKIYHSISSQLLNRVLFCYLIFAASVTIVHMVIDYKNTQNSIQNEVFDIYLTVSKGISIAQWDMDINQITSIAEGIITLPLVSGVKIVDEFDKLQVSQGEYIDGFEVIYAEQHQHQQTEDFLIFQAPVYYKSRGIKHLTGRILLFIHKNAVLERVKLGFILLIVNAIIKTLALWCLFIFFLKRIVTNPLHSFISQLKTPDSSEMEIRPVTVDAINGSEINLLQQEFNFLVKNINMARSKFSALNVQLEAQVEERTKDLKRSLSTLLEQHKTLQTMQKQLVQAEKMSALGGLVAGVAHELNTPIGNSLTAVSTALNETRDIIKHFKSERISKLMLSDYLMHTALSLELIERNINKATRLVKSFKSVAVDQSINDRRQFNLKEYVNEILTTFSHEVRHRPINFQVEISGDINLNSVAGAFGQVLTNLLLNALKHAFDGESKGTIYFIGKKISQDKVELKVKDNGLGMTTEVLEKIFDPFFTTKRDSGGSGLGLHIAFNIVTQTLGGSIEVKSKINCGTCFTMLLPLSSPEQEEVGSIFNSDLPGE